MEIVATIVVSMARKPNTSSPIAIIRTALGLDAAQFAELVGCGKSTIQHVETGRPLKAELADKIHLATGAPREWLDRETLTIKEADEWAQAQKEPVHPSLYSARRVGSNFYKLQAIVFCLARKGINPQLAVLAVERALEEVIRRFNLDHEEVSQVITSAMIQDETEKHIGAVARARALDPDHNAVEALRREVANSHSMIHAAESRAFEATDSKRPKKKS